MAAHSLVYKPSVAKDLRSLPKSAVERVLERIESLRDDPRPRQSIKLTGSEDLYRLRVGDYRVIYGIDKKGRRGIVHYVRHRKDAYR